MTTGGRLRNLASLVAAAPPEVGATPSDVVHAENKWRLLRYRGPSVAQKKRTPVLVVPSLINRHYVLDLLPGKSFVEFLLGEGHDVFLVDWGRPGPEDRLLGFDELADGYLGRAIRRTAAAAGAEKVHLLGYCLGGTLAAIHASVRPERVASIAALAAPMRFADDGQLSAWTRARGLDVGALASGFGNVPAWLMQSAFRMLRPTMTLSKAVHLVDNAADDEFLAGYRALDRWANENVDFPGEVFRRYVDELYREDRLVEGLLRVGGRPARLDAIACPVLCVTFEHDPIVPWRSAAVLLERVASSDKVHLHLPGGHVSSVVSRGARRRLWPQISSFWAEREI